jgi:hypothetical protein
MIDDSNGKTELESFVEKGRESLDGNIHFSVIDYRNSYDLNVGIKVYRFAMMRLSLRCTMNNLQPEA